MLNKQAHAVARPKHGQHGSKHMPWPDPSMPAWQAALRTARNGPVNSDVGTT